MICELCSIKDFIVHWVLPLLFGLRNFETIQYALCHRKFSYMINQKFMKLCTLQDPNMKMCPSSFPRIMSLKVVFQICFGSINKKFSVGYLIIPSWKYFEKKKNHKQAVRFTFWSWARQNKTAYFQEYLFHEQLWHKTYENIKQEMTINYG